MLLQPCTAAAGVGLHVVWLLRFLVHYQRTWFLDERCNERWLESLTDEDLSVDDERFTQQLQLFVSVVKPRQQPHNHSYRSYPLILSHYFAAGMGAKYCNEYACYLSVCSHNSKTTKQNCVKFYLCCLWPWLSPHLMVLRYVMYVRFCGRHHAFRTIAIWRTMCIPKKRQNTTSITAKIPTKFCLTIKTGSTYCELSIRGKVCCLWLPEVNGREVTQFAVDASSIMSQIRLNGRQCHENGQ